MFFFKSSDGTWMPCGPKQSGAIQITMQDLAEKGLAEKVSVKSLCTFILEAGLVMIYSREFQWRVCRRAYVSFLISFV